MSRISKIEATCPKCNKTFTITAYTEIDAVLDPDIADEAATGRLFWAECPKCGFSEQVNVPCLYIDFQRNIYVYYAASPDVEKKALSLIDQRRKRYSTRREAVTRLVFGLGEFAEKILIFQSNLDDRVVEYTKLQLEDRFAKTHQQDNIQGVHLTDVGDNVLYFTLETQDSSYSGQLDFAAYEHSRTLMEDKELYFKGDPPYVGRGWLNTIESALKQIESGAAEDVSEGE